MRTRGSRRSFKLKCESLEERVTPGLVTERLLDINQYTIDSIPAPGVLYDYFQSAPTWTNINGTIYFAAHEGPTPFDTAQTELYRTDGTVSGTALVRDIVPGFYGSNPNNFAAMNGVLYFSATDTNGAALNHGRELWRSDGTAAGTYMVKDIDTGTSFPDSYPSQLTPIDGMLYFVAQDDSGFDLWKTDGTQAGTVKVKDFQPPSGYGGGAAESPTKLTNVNGTLFFTAVGGPEGRALWKSDGTEAGTVLVKDLDPDTLSSTIDNFTGLNNLVVFTTKVVSDNSTTYFLWRSDGTPQGTVSYASFTPHFSSDYPQQFTVANGHAFFTTDDGSHGVELWKTDGTVAGTGMVADLWPGTSSSSPAELTAVGSTLYFKAFSPTSGSELWKSDGTTAGTSVVADLVPGTSGSYPQKLIGAAGRLYFSRKNSANDEELWKSDGTAAGTVLVTVVSPGLAMTVANEIGVGSGLYFSAIDQTHGREIWHSDGTVAGTVMIKDINTNTADGIGDGPTVINNVAFFAANDGAHGAELWRTDGTAAGTQLVKDINPAGKSGLVIPPFGGFGNLTQSTTNYLTAMNGVLYFVADDGTTGQELWRSDGTATGTYQVKDIAGGAAPSSPRDLTVVGNTVFFTAYQNSIGRELWKTDGTSAGTVLVKDINTAVGPGSEPFDLTAVGNVLFFDANVSGSFRELWRSDGTDAGTYLVKDISPNSSAFSGRVYHSRRAYLTNVSGTLYFVADDGTHGRELWKSDGTAAGTVMIKDINTDTSSAQSFGSAFTRYDPSPQGYFPTIQLSVMNGLVYFAAYEPVHGRELWQTDGTDSGTVLVKDINPGYQSGIWRDNLFVGDQHVVGNAMYFAADDGQTGTELWKTDGTTAGTVLVKDVQNPDRSFFYPGSFPLAMSDANGVLYFNADDWDHNRELWKSDGTAAGTVMVKDINDIPPGFLGSYPGEVTPVNGVLLFGADDGRTGVEWWTIREVPPVANIAPVYPNPRHTTVDDISISFSEPVAGFDLGDLMLTRNGATIPLDGVTLSTLDNVTFTLSGLTSLTGNEGNYQLWLPAAGSGITDADEIAMAADATTAWVMDTTGPTVTNITSVQPDPRNTPVTYVDVTFSEPIDPTTFHVGNIVLTRDSVPIDLSDAIVVPLSDSSFEVYGLDSATALDGAYVLTVDATGVEDLAQNMGVGSATEDWKMDTVGPTLLTVGPIAPNPRNSAVSTIDVTFSEPIDLTTFTSDNLRLTLDGRLVPFDFLPIESVGGSVYRVNGLESLTTSEGSYALAANAGGVSDLAGNVGSGLGVGNWIMDTTAPTVMVNQAADQGDPANGPEIHFDVAFNEPVVGFDASKVNLSGTAGGTLSATVSPGADPNTYIIAVTGMTASGTVVADIGANVVSDLAGNGNAGSTSTDNQVIFDIDSPSATIHPAADQSNPGGGQSVAFTVLFSEPVVGFDASKVNLSSSTAPGALIAAVSGSGQAYTVIATGMTAGGTVVASIDASKVNDLAGNGNTASNSASVSYIHSGVLEFSSATYDIDEAGAPTLTVTVRRIGGVEDPLSVQYATGGGTAVPNTNFGPVSGTLSWLDGDAADKSFTVRILDDGQIIGNSTFGISLSDVSLGGALGETANAMVTIHETSLLEFGQSGYRVSESGGTAVITVHRLFGDRGPVSVNYSTSDESATADADYTAVAGTLTWEDGDTNDKSFSIPIIDDTISEGKETIYLALSTPTGNSSLGTNIATDLIIDKSDGRTAGTQPFTDYDGDLVTIKLNGRVGTLTYYLTNGTGPIAEIDLDSTSPTKSSVAVVVKKPRHGTGDGRINIGEVDGSGLKSFTARSSDLVGAGIHLDGFIGSLTIGDVLNGADIELAGTGPTANSATRIVTGVIADNTDLSVAGPLNYLRAIAVGKGSWTAPNVGSIVITGRKASKTTGAVAGDFESDLVVTGAGLASTKLAALKSFTAVGAVRGATLQVGSGVGTAGTINAIRVGSFLDSQLFAGYTGDGDGSGSFNLPGIVKSFLVTGRTNGFADSIVIASTFRNVSLGSVESDNGATAFGFLFHDAIGRLFAQSPPLRYDPKGPDEQKLAGDFIVKKV